LSQDFRGKGSSLRNTFGFYKTRHVLLSDSANCTVLRAVVLTQYWHVTDRQTDGRTDGIAIASTVLAMRALWCAVKTALGKEKLANCFTLTILLRTNKLLSYPSQTAHRTYTTKTLQNSTYIKTATAQLAQE